MGKHTVIFKRQDMVTQVNMQVKVPNVTPQNLAQSYIILKLSLKPCRITLITMTTVIIK